MIQDFLNAHVVPAFLNKPFMKPVFASMPMERIQIDLLYLSCIPVKKENQRTNMFWLC